jgi:phenylacetate-CoA ligase
MPSHHILVTNLANGVQPLIRYRIEDSFTQAPPAPGHGRLRASVEGRADEVLRWGTIEIHPLVIRAALLKHPEVLDYQVRQTADGVELALVAPALDCAAALCEAIATALDAAGLTRPRVEARTVESLARLRETGKLRRFVPLSR